MRRRKTHVRGQGYVGILEEGFLMKLKQGGAARLYSPLIVLINAIKGFIYLKRRKTRWLMNIKL